MTYCRISLAILASAVALASGAALAELPPLSPEQMRAQADTIIVGRIVAVYSYDKPGTSEQTRRGSWVDTRSVAEVAVTTVEKGGVLKKGEIAFVRFWTAKERPTGWTGPGGHRPPRVGDELRVHVARAHDGGFDVLVPNGFAQLK